MNRKSRRLLVACVKPILGLVVLAITLVDPTIVRAQSEDEIKAAFLLNFARYVEWPASAFSSEDAPLQICTLNADAFGSVVSTIILGKTVATHDVQVRTVASAAAATECHILFVGAGSGSASDVTAALGASSVFTIADDPDFARDGGVANFFQANNRVRFSINQAAAENVGLKISSQLLRLAQLVK